MSDSSRTLNIDTCLNGIKRFKDKKDCSGKICVKRKKLHGKCQIIKTKQLWKVEVVKYLINDLKNDGPGNSIHLNVLSQILKKPINVWKSNGCFYRTINGDGVTKNKTRRLINVEYHEQKSTCIGHWTLPGNRDPANIEKNLNACLFTVIASQTGRSAKDLRIETIDYLENNIKILADQIDEFLSSNGKNITPLMIGGARYNGTSPQMAKVILDNSQNVLCYGYKDYGHPRGHASDKNATRPRDSVENYSRLEGLKSGFLSRNDQDYVAYFALSHKAAQQAMQNLNNGARNQALTLLAQELRSKGCVLPKMKEWYRGEEFSGELDIEKVTLVLRHHKGEYQNPNADVFVHTFYPRSS